MTGVCEVCGRSFAECHWRLSGHVRVSEACYRLGYERAVTALRRLRGTVCIHEPGAAAVLRQIDAALNTSHAAADWPERGE